MSFVSGAAKNDPAPNAFASQYISIVLIIFTCIIWAYFSKAVGALNKSHTPVLHKAQELVQAQSAPRENPDISSMDLPDLFQGETINQDAFDALVIFLSSHDIDATFEIYAPKSAEERAFARNRELSERLYESELPKSASRIFIVDSSGNEGVRVSFKKALPEPSVGRSQ